MPSERTSTLPRPIEDCLDRIEGRLGLPAGTVMDGELGSSPPDDQVALFLRVLPEESAWPEPAAAPAGWESLCVEVVAGDREQGRPSHLVTVAARSNFDGLEDLRKFLRNGLLSLDTDPALAPRGTTRKSRTCIVSSEIVGPVRSGGIGTACTSLARALAAAEHEVVIVYVGGFEETGDPAEHWIAEYAKDGVTLHCLDVAPRKDLDFDLEYLRRPWLVCEHLRRLEAEDGAFDAIHFAECNGLGYYAIQAKQCGLAFAETALCVATHGSTRWHLDGNRSWMDRVFHYVEDHTEPYTIEHCDVLHAPSHYLADWAEAQGWLLPDRILRMPYVQPQTAREAIDRSQPLARVTDLNELVLFGRQETRKGVVVLCDALDRLASDPEGLPSKLTITFLGKPGVVEGGGARHYLEERATAGSWPWQWRLIGDLDQAGANEYLQGKGRLALMPSLVDNYPNTVMECLGLGVPFLASAAGGIPEIIHPEDVAEATFPSPPGFDWGGSLAMALRRALADGIRPARPAFDREEVESAWIRWHGLVAATGPPRPEEAASLRTPRRPPREITASSSASIGALVDRAEPLIVVPEGLSPQPDAARKMVDALKGDDLDLVGAMSSATPDGEPRHFPLAWPAWLPAVVPETGDQPLLLSHDVVEALLDEAPDTPLTAPHLLAVALSLGEDFRHAVLPEVLFTGKHPETPENSPWQRYGHLSGAVATLPHDLPSGFRHWPHFLQALRELAAQREREIEQLQWQVDEGYGRVEAHNGKLATRIDELGVMIAEQEQRIETEITRTEKAEALNEELTTMNEELRNELAALHEEMRRINGEVERLRKAESNHEERLGAHAERFEEVFNSLNDRLATRDEKIAALREKSKTLEEKSKTLATRVEEIGSRKSGGFFRRG